MAARQRGRKLTPPVTEPIPLRHAECALCLEQYKSPRILPCFHTFCLACLERLTQGQQPLSFFPCPSCRTPVQIPQGGVGKFQVNFYVEAAMENLQLGQRKAVPVCDMCGSNPATYKCSDCDQFACDNCTAIHAKIGATKSHTVLNLNATNPGSGRAVVRERYCQTHTDEKVRFFCCQCNCVLCRDCKLTTHEGHPTTDLSERSEAARKMLLDVSRMARESLAPKLKATLKSAESQREELAGKREEILSTFQQRAEHVRQMVDSCLLQAAQTLSQQAEAIDKETAQAVDDMQQQIACLESLCQHAQRVAETGNDADILSLPSQMTEFFGVANQALQQADWFNPRRKAGVVLNYQGPGFADNNTRLQVFTNEQWRKRLQLTEVPNQQRHGQKALQQMITSAVGSVTTSLYCEEKGEECGFVFGVNVELQNRRAFRKYGKQVSQKSGDIANEISVIQNAINTWNWSTTP